MRPGISTGLSGSGSCSTPAYARVSRSAPTTSRSSSGWLSSHPPSAPRSPGRAGGPITRPAPAPSDDPRSGLIPRAEVDQRKAYLRPVCLAQFRGRLTDDDFEGGPDMAVQQVAAAGAAVRQAKDRVQVRLRPVATGRDVPDEREHLALLGHIDRPVLPGYPVEPADGRLLEGADRGDLGGRQALLAGEGRYDGDGLVTGIEHEHICWGGRRVDDLRVHPHLHGVGCPSVSSGQAGRREHGLMCWRAWVTPPTPR